MRKTLKWIGIGLGAIALVSGLIFAYVAATFDPNEYKPSIIEAVQSKTGRTLQLPGKLSLSFYPSIGAKLGEATLSEPKSTRPFASVASALVSVKVMPLLSRKVIVDAVELKGLRLNVERDKSGRTNFDDLAGAEKKPEDKAQTPVEIDIARIEISDADVTYSDQASGKRYRFSKLDLKTGRIASGVTTPVELAALVAVDKDQLDVKLKTKLTFDAARKLYKLDGLDFSAKGDYAGVTGMNATAKGDVEARTESGEYAAKDLALTVTGKRAGGDLKVKLDAPKLTLTREKVEGSRIAIDAKIDEPKSKLAAKITLGGVQGTFAALKAAPLEAEIDVQGEGRTVKAKLNGAAQANLDKGSAALEFTGKIDESNVNGKVGVLKFSPLALSFDLNADQLDADRVMGRAPPSKGAASKQASASEKKKEDRIDLSALKGITADGKLTIGKLTLLNLKSSQVNANIKVAGGRLEVAPMSAQLYQGTLNGSLSAQAADNAVFAVKQTLNGVAVGPLLRDAAQIDTLEGKGTVSADLTTHGATVDALKKALNGTASVKLADGSVKGIDIAGTIRSARGKIDQLRGQPVQSASKTEKTDFSELTATFNVKNGVARNDDLSIKSPLLRVSGAGDIDIGNDRMNYVLKATVVSTSKGQGGRDAADLSGVTVPVKLTGALDSPQWSIDFAGMITDLAKSQLKDEILKRIPGAQPATPGAQPGAPAGGSSKDTIQDRLKGILGR